MNPHTPLTHPLRAGRCLLAGLLLGTLLIGSAPARLRADAPPTATFTGSVTAAERDEFRVTGSMNTARSHHTATLLPQFGGKVLVAGGSGLSSAEVYDPDTGAWSVTGRMNTARYDQHTATLLPDGRGLDNGVNFTDRQLALGY